MTFEAEWAALRAESTQKVDMRLNGVESGSGGQAGLVNADLAVNQDHLGAIGHDAYGLRNRLSKEGDHARPSTFDAAIALTNGNFSSGSALLKVHDRWNTHLKTLLDACAQISNHLDYTKSAHAKDDAQIGGDLISVSKLNEYLK
ncbi:hypothetical protein GCM10015535_40390 [Streptomyces gelaticus]|uniref:AG1 protein n=1 Tax=Streptomyces gelaticus TaxID=285446 RepID=A0ABQ2W4S1_9ACTN|nr:hypothetical protein [Streptomyces gelaticus]GGV88659.1 hypothetical protein GCM10015535_40390 [Streptomyces gelaticus]